MHFHKYQGTGNDFIIIDNRDLQLDITSATSYLAQLCSRRFGIGADGFIAVEPSEAGDFRMRYLNADGNESTLCGNGTRCVVSFVHSLGIIGSSCQVETSVGLIKAAIQGKEVKIQMPRPSGFKKLNETSFWIDTGSPHYVKYVNTELEKVDVATEGKKLRQHAAFESIGGTNVNFLSINTPGNLSVRTFERGVEAETFSCGTGVTACAFVHHQLHPSLDRLNVDTLGGKLQVSIEQENGTPTVYLQGPAEFVFEGNI